MTFNLSKPILYLITRGASSEGTTPASVEFQYVLTQVSVAVAAGIDLIQLREKRLPARVLFELTERAVAITNGSPTRLLVNDRADVAAGAGADGVHLTAQSVDAFTIRRTFGEHFIIGASTHSLQEAHGARKNGADFVVFGPVFATASKTQYGPPVGIQELKRVSAELCSFPVLALGGVNSDNAAECLRGGASGIAGISLFEDSGAIPAVVAKLRP